MNKSLIGLIADPADEDLLEYTYHLCHGYVVRNSRVGETVSRRKIYLHKVILERKLHRDIKSYERGDHKNRNKLDNRRENLRAATVSEDRRNTNIRSSNTSGFRGVVKNHQKWAAQININGMHVYLGTYDTKEEASRIFLDKYYETYHEYPPEISTEG